MAKPVHDQSSLMESEINPSTGQGANTQKNCFNETILLSTKTHVRTDRSGNTLVHGKTKPSENLYHNSSDAAFM